MEDMITPAGYVVLAEGTIASDYALKNLNKSLGEAQSEFLPAVKGEENKWGGYKYTPLVAIVMACRAALTKYHLTVSQLPGADLERKTAVIHTRVVHWDSGEWFQNSLELPAELALGKDGAPKFNQQTVGGTFTYLQKYAYKTNMGIPDSEELIDSTEEKGDLPSRARRQTSPGTPETLKDALKASVADTSVVRSQFFAKAKELGWGLGEIKKYLIAVFQDGSTSKLSEKQLADTLEAFGQVKPEEYFAPAPEPSDTAE